MSDWAAYTLAALALLAAPGPTNTLLATSGAAAGLQRSLHLIVAVIFGYCLAILALALAVWPLIRASQPLDVGLRVACGVYLLYAAWRLWREGAAALTGAAPVKFRRVFVATLLNPKAIVFAFAIVPHLDPLDTQAATPYLAALAVMAGVVGAAWIGLGSALHTRVGSGADSGVARRVGALVLCVFAILISGSAFSA